jgi:tricorn protease
MVPLNAIPGVKALLVNEVNASAAETFALMFKLGKIGTVVGRRTAGAGIGRSVFTASFIDGGRVVIPERAAYDPAGTWAIENHGVEPDSAVEIRPADWRAERDPQLRAALRAITVALQERPPQIPKRPEPPKHR